jgi:hypothetical protein
MRDHYSDGMGISGVGSTCYNLEKQWRSELAAGDADAANRTEQKLLMHGCNYDSNNGI